MTEHQTHGSDTGAAFTGLIGGAFLIGIVLYGIVLLTNRHFEGEEEAGGHKASVTDSGKPKSLRA